MINIKNITKVLLLAMFISVCSFDNSFAKPLTNKEVEQMLADSRQGVMAMQKNNQKTTSTTSKPNPYNPNASSISSPSKSGSSQGKGKSGSSKSPGGGSQPKVTGNYQTAGSEIDRSKTSGEAPFTINSRLPVVSSAAVSTISSNITQDSSFCGEGTGVFGELVKTGQTIFYRLRDLIYVVAGFGIIAVAVGGFFGNMNWKWLSAIVLALIVIASAGELIVLLTGCEQYGTTLITNTLKAPTKTVDVQGE